MLCKKCGKVIKQTAKFCPYCGTKIELIDVQVENNLLDEFEIEKQKIAQQELEDKIKKEEELKEKYKNKKTKENRIKIKNMLSIFCSFFIILSSLFLIGVSVHSLFFELCNNTLIFEQDDVMLKIDGILQKNIRIKVKGKTYYLGENGRSQLYKILVIGEKIKAQEENGTFVFDKTIKINDDFYHFDNEGEAIKNELFDECYFNNEGKMLIDDWNEDSYFGPDGKIVRNQVMQINGNYYNFDINGNIYKNKFIDGKFYGNDGKMIVNQWNGDYYYDSDGDVLKNQWVGEYYVGSDGKYLKSSWTPDNFYVDYDGKKAFDKIISYGGCSYYINSDGKKALNQWINYNNNKYHTDANGVLITQKIFNDSGKNFYLKKDGAMLKNSLEDGYFADANGEIAINKAVGLYYFGENGQAVVDKWIGTDYYGKDGKQVTTGWAQDFYLENGIIQTNKWVDGGNYYVGDDGIYLKNTYIEGCELGPDGKWTGVVNYGIEIALGDDWNYTHKTSDYDGEELEQTVSVLSIDNIESVNSILSKNQLSSMKMYLNSILKDKYQEYKNKIKSSKKIERIELNDVIKTEEKYNEITFYCNVTSITFSGRETDLSFYMYYKIK